MPAESNVEEIKKEIKKKVSEISEIPEAELSDEARFVEDLGIDSMMALEIAASVEKQYKILIPEEKIATLRCLQNVYELVQELLQK